MNLVSCFCYECALNHEGLCCPQLEGLRDFNPDKCPSRNRPDILVDEEGVEAKK